MSHSNKIALTVQAALSQSDVALLPAKGGVLTVMYLSGMRDEKLPTMVFTMGAVSPRMPSIMPTSELDQPYADWVKMGSPSM